MCPNLILDDNIGLWLSKNTKNSPLSTILLMDLRNHEGWRRTIFKEKKVKIKNFELYKCYIPQKKAENMYNSDSGRKSTISSKKKVFFPIFFNFRVIIEAAKNFPTYNFSKKF